MRNPQKGHMLKNEGEPKLSDNEISREDFFLLWEQAMNGAQEQANQINNMINGLVNIYHYAMRNEANGFRIHYYFLPDQGLFVLPEKKGALGYDRKNIGE